MRSVARSAEVAHIVSSSERAHRLARFGTRATNVGQMLERRAVVCMPSMPYDAGVREEAGYGGRTCLPSSCRTVARPACRTAHCRDASELRNCSKVAGKLFSKCRAVAPGAKFRHKFGQPWLRLPQVWPMLAQVGSRPGKLSHFLPDAGHCLADSGQLLAPLGPTRAIVGQHRPTLVRVGQLWPRSAKQGPTSVSSMARFDQLRAKLGQHR